VGAAKLGLAVFRPNYDRDNWHFSLNDKDNDTPYLTREAAQAAALHAAIAWIDSMEQIRKALKAALEQADLKAIAPSA
jgi:uncharacterized protein YprB with RNaseH-like and TPR domain